VVAAVLDFGCKFKHHSRGEQKVTRAFLKNVRSFAVARGIAEL